MIITPIVSLITNLFSGVYNKQLLGSIVVLFGVYSFFIGHTVIAIDQRQSMTRQIQATTTNVSALQINYFNLASSITMTKATELGFVDSQTPDFAYTNPEAQTFAMK